MTAPTAARAAAPVATLAVAALLFNAFTWGLSWWPLRALEARGLHALWTTVLVYAVVVVALTLLRPRAWLEVARTPALWVLVLAAGTTNATFNWGVTVGDVVRVVLLFYLMPLWAVLLSRWLLHEPLTPLAGLRVALALAGAAIVLWPAEGGLPLPRALAEWLAVLGGFSFALNNVMLRREAARSDASRALAMFFGGVLVAGVVAVVMSLSSTPGAPHAVPWPPTAPGPWMWGVALLAGWFLLSNLSLQYGAARLPGNVTAVVMITEVLFAALSAVWLGAGAMTPQLWLGGTLIVAAALLAARG